MKVSVNTISNNLSQSLNIKIFLEEKVHIVHPKHAHQFQ